MATTKEKWQEIANRGLQDKFDPQVRLKFDEAVNRGLITLPQQQPLVQPPQPIPVQQVSPDIPTEANLQAEQQRVLQSQDPRGVIESGVDELLGAGEAATSVISSAIAQPISGIIGGLEAAGRSLGNMLGLDGGDAAAEGTRTINAVKDFLTVTPDTQEGQRNLRVMSDIIKSGIDLANVPISGLVGLGELLSGQGLEQAADSVERVQDEGLGNTLGERILEETGSPELAAIAFTAPDAAIEILGLKGLMSSTIDKSARLSGDAKEALKQAAPTINQLKGRSRQLYNELDQSGVKVKPDVFEGNLAELNKVLDEAGIDRDLHPKSTAVLRRLSEEVGEAKSFGELNTLRQIASDAAFTQDASDARLGKIILNNLDDGIDKLAEVAGRDARGARNLWRRAKVAETMSDMIENAGLAASGFENGLRIEARKILRSKKKSKGFSRDELKALRELDQGSTAANAAKFLGKFGISEGKATSMLGTVLGGGIGEKLGGIPGASLVIALGQTAKLTAQRLTLNNAKFADQLVKAGGDGRAITRAYLNNTPKSKRNINDLTELLLDPKVTAESIKKIKFKDKLVDDAAFFAAEIKRRAKKAASTAAIAQPELEEEQ